MSRIFQVFLHIRVVQIVYKSEKVKEVSLNCSLPSVFLNYVIITLVLPEQFEIISWKQS